MELDQISRRIELIEKIQTDIKNAREILNGELENDETYRVVLEEANEVNSKKKRIKDEIMHAGSNQKLAQEIKDNAEELKTLREILSAELVQLYKEKDTDIFTDINGELRKFKLSVKLMPKGSRYDNRDDEGKYSNPE